MAFINVAEWTAANTAQWLKGLDDCILPYVQFFLNNNINGCRLLLLSCEDLNHLNVRKVGHQELILDAVDLLKHLHYNFGSETLQSLALRLGCKARSLYNQLKHNKLVVNNNNNNECDSGLDHSSSPEDTLENSYKVSTQTLSAVSDILAAVKAFISWIDRYPFEGQDLYIPVRKTILRLSIELASTAQRDQFVDKPNEVIENSCITLAELSDRIVQELNDSLAIQPAVLDIVTVKKKPEEELGMHIHSSYSGIHIVGGIKFQSPAHRCGRIEEGDEIVQVTYQTVVGWQLKKLVSSMKEHPTEIVLTIKKRPRHSNLIGQVIVLKPYKIPNRKAGRQSSSGRLKNAATTTGSDGDDDAFLANDKLKTGSKPVYQLYPRKPKVPVRRRATISGSSPTVCQPPIRIEDLVHNMNKKESQKEYNRSVSHDSPTTRQPNRSRGLSAPSEAATHSVPLNANQSVNNVNNNCIKSDINSKLCINNNNNNIINNNIITGNKPLNGTSGSALPYAKVHPFPNEEPIHRKRSEFETTPKKIVDSKQTDFAKDMSEKMFKPVAKEHSQRLASAQALVSPSQVVAGEVKPVSPVTITSYQLINDIQPKSDSKQTTSDKINRLLKSPLLRRRSPKETVGWQPSPTVERRVVRSEAKPGQRHSSRRVSCKELGEGDCQGWLYQRKERHRFAGLGHSSRWTKRWVVLKSNYLYCYKDQNEAKAECLIHLPGFTVAPALDCKSKKYAFKLFNPSTAFQFASESHPDMSAWMSKMGLAAISYMTPNALLPEAFYYSETEDSDDGLNSPSTRRLNKHISASKANPLAIYREQSPAGLSTSSSDTTNSIKEELYGCRSRKPFSSSNSITTSNSSPFHDIRSQLKPSLKTSHNPYQSHSIGSPSPIPHSPASQPRMGYMRSASSLEANDVVAARNRQALADSGNTRYAKIVFPQSQSPKGSFSPQIAPRRLCIPYGKGPDSNSLDRQRLNFLKDLASGNTQKIISSFNAPKEMSDNQSDATDRKPQPPRPLPRKSITRRETGLPAIVSNMADTYEQLNKAPETRIASIPNTPPTRPAVPKPNEKLNGQLRTEQNADQKSDDTYEYVFRPTMAQIKTGIVNPLYERVPNNTWSGDSRHNSTGKSRMPLPNEMRPDLTEQTASQELRPVPSDSRLTNELSILDREYNRLYGAKKPNERLSPKTALPSSFIPKSASSAEIENIYTHKPRTASASSIGHFDDSSAQSTPSFCRERPKSPSSSDNSMSSSSGISSYYSTYLEIPAQQMQRLQSNHKRQTASTSSFHSAKSSTPPMPSADSRAKAFDFSDSAIGQQKKASDESPSGDQSSKGAKFPQKSSSFRLFSSPKLLKKLSTPKYHKERHLEKKDSIGGKTIPTPEPSPGPVSKTTRLFLGSPKLTRALFGGSGSSKKSPPPPPSVPSPPEMSRSAKQKPNHSPITCDQSSALMNRSSSDSSVQSSTAGVQHKSHHIIEKKLTKPELTIQLPLLTESSTDSSEMPLTPETPRKPTMGVAMIGKKRRPSNVSTDRSDIETAVNQYYGQQTSHSSPYTTEDTDDEWASIVRTIEGAGRQLETDRPVPQRREQKEQTNRTIDDDKLCRLVLNLRAVQRRLKPEQHKELAAIEELLGRPITGQVLDQWIAKYPDVCHLLPSLRTDSFE